MSRIGSNGPKIYQEPQASFAETIWNDKYVQAAVHSLLKKYTQGQGERHRDYHELISLAQLKVVEFSNFSKSRLATIQNPKAFLVTMINNAFIDFVQASSNLTEITFNRNHAEVARLDACSCGSSREPVELMQEAELHELLHRSVEKLTPLQSQVVDLKLQGFSNEDIANMLGKKLNHIYQLWFKAKAHLEPYLAPHITDDAA